MLRGPDEQPPASAVVRTDRGEMFVGFGPSDGAPRDRNAILESGAPILAAALERSTPAKAALSMNDVELRVPLSRPGKIIASSGDYNGHLDADQARLGHREGNPTRIRTRDGDLSQRGPRDDGGHGSRPVARDAGRCLRLPTTSRDHEPVIVDSESQRAPSRLLNRGAIRELTPASAMHRAS
jgi:hypothetical protein